jgi:hypothetical protein
LDENQVNNGKKHTSWSSTWTTTWPNKDATRDGHCAGKQKEKWGRTVEQQEESMKKNQVEMMGQTQELWAANNKHKGPQDHNVTYSNNMNRVGHSYQEGHNLGVALHTRSLCLEFPLFDGDIVP